MSLIFYPEVISETAFADQAKRIEELGGIDGIHAREKFDHTPVKVRAGS